MAAENAVSADLVSGTLQSENEELSRLNCTEGHLAWPPEIYFGQNWFRR
jgi:hypothetical protein